MCRITVSLVVSGVLFSGSAFAQPEALREAVKEKLDDGEVSDIHIPIAKKIAKGEDPEGVPLFNVEWDHSLAVLADPAQVFVLAGTVDVEGNLVFLGRVIDGPGISSFIAKYTSEGDLVWIESISDDGGHIRQKLTVDIDGNIYVGFYNTMDDTSTLTKYSPSGSDRWSQIFATSDSELEKIEVDEDGNVYAIGLGRFGGVNKPVVERYRPDGVPLWKNTYEGFGGAGGSADFEDVLSSAIDRFGNIRIGGVGPDSHFVASINPLGDVDWVHDFSDRSESAGPVVDVNCNTYFAERFGRQVIVTGFNSDGDQIYRTTVDDVISAFNPYLPLGGMEIVVDRDGLVHVAYAWAQSEMPGRQFDLLLGFAQIGPAGQVVQSTVRKSTNFELMPGARLYGLELDRFGNPYVLVNRRAALGSGNNAVVYKYDKDNLSGSLPWFHSLINTGPANSDLFMAGIFVDFGDNIYFYGGDNDGIGFNRARFGKISQPYTAVPMIAKNSPDLLIDNQSLWGEFVGSASAETSFFQINASQTQFNVGLSETFSLPLLGDFGGTFDLDGNMSMGMGFAATASGGIVDISYPGDLDIAVPGSAKLVAGAPFTITAEFEAHSSGNIVSDGTPELSAGLKGNVGLNINSGASLVAFSDEIASFPLVNANVGWSGLIPGLSMSLPTGSPGSWVDFGDERNLVSGRLTRPLFTSNGSISSDTGNITSNLEPEVFFSLRGNMTNYISTYQFGTPTIYGFGEGTSSAGSFGASVNIAQAFAQIELEANQSLTFEPTVSVIYEFTPPVNIHVPGGPTLQNQTSYEVAMNQDGTTWTGAINISVSGANLPASNSVLIRPRSKVAGTLRNRTWVDIQPLVGWETLAAEAHADAFGESLFSFEFCVLCYDVPLSADIPIELFDSTLNLPDTIVELDPIAFLVDPNGNPRVGGASRGRLTSFIYDQVDANPFELVGFLNAPTKKMLIYGDNFFEVGKFPIAQFVLCSQGRVEPLPTTILNSRTALVEIPNEMRLVPGIARIWAVNGSGNAISDSIDFPIELPTPNLGTAGPNLWAADPRLSNIAIDVIDGLTAAGTPSFIARRDYWYVLSDMWDDINAGNGTSLFDSFPLYDFTAEPPMPAVLIALTEYPLLADTRHHWSFDGDFTDSAGLADGTPGGTTPEFVTEGVPSYLGEAAEFSGGSMTLDRPTMTNVGGTDYSVAFWMKLNNSGASNRTIFSSKAAGVATGLIIRVVNGSGIVYLGGVNGNAPMTFSNGLTFPTDGKWHHYVVTLDRSHGVYWYRNGEFETFQTDPNGKFGFINAFHSDFITIGMGRDGSNNDANPLHGQLSDLNIFKRTLSAGEIQTLSSPPGQMPIGRFKQPVENGILYSLMPKSEYDEPKLVSISLDVAGPGGGKSNSIDLTVAAPQPVVSNVIPRQIFPDAGQFVMTVEGPLSVPYFNGFEEERFGNFNKASIVHWDGIPLATTFVTPGTLRAVVPPEMTMLQGNALITVETPSNETGYFDSFTGGIVESGGESNWLVLNVSYPTPIITAMSPEVTSKAIIDRCPDNPGTVRLKITGEDFWPGATIWVDGVERVTTVQSSKGGLILRGVTDVDLSYNVIYTDLNIADLSRIYSAPVIVMNPDGTISDRVYLDIVDESTYEAYYGVTLPPQSMPGACK